MSASRNIVPTSPFIQFATLPISTGSFEAAMDIFGPFADVVERTVPGCLEFALYKSVNNETGEINIIISERYVNSEAHDKFTSSSVYQNMINQTVENNVLRGESVLTPVEAQVGGFTNRG
ncbi:hypothetical protein VPNG_07305 [Cytospora leucostoma]|uniref:ABM domain-containing protein n=1 Tax=Cytospora leucostoma TaxID=1230097 RepID=A0A423WKF1_9PEZI|nr:hypothetical protein VPNG_07305 [Cytospora leucostoma]